MHTQQGSEAPSVAPDENLHETDIPVDYRPTVSSQGSDVPSPFPSGGLPLRLTHPNFSYGPSPEQRKDSRGLEREYEIEYKTITSKEVNRYKRGVKVVETPETKKSISIPKDTRAFKDAGTMHQRYMSDGWFKCIHPEGAVYFIHTKQRVLTDADLLNGDILKAATKSVEELNQIAENESMTLPDSSELVLELELAEEPPSIVLEWARAEKVEEKQKGQPKDKSTNESEYESTSDPDSDSEDYSLQAADNYESEPEEDNTPGPEPSSGEVTLKAKVKLKFRCGYYFVSHEDRSLFWAHDFKTDMFGKVKGVKRLSHLGQRIESFYWRHCELFPNHRPVTHRIFDEFRELVYYAISDGVTSPESLVPFDADELIPISGMLQHRNEIVNRPCDHTVYIISQFMRAFAYARFRDFYGQPGARLNARQTVYYDQSQGTLFLKIFSPITFNASDIYMQAFRRVSVDHLVNRLPLKKFLDKLNDELKGYTLYSTVVLNANIVFLALIYVSPPATSTDNHPQTVAQVLSYVSTVASMGSVVLGLVLFRQHPQKAIDDAVSFFNKMVNRPYGIETLAVIYSLPYGCLVWGMIFFAAAFGALAFQMTGLVTRIVVCTVGAVTLGLIGWVSLIIWDRPPWMTLGYWKDKQSIIRKKSQADPKTTDGVPELTPSANDRQGTVSSASGQNSGEARAETV